MKAKHFFIGVVGSVLACFSVLSLLLVAADPFFVLRGLEEGETSRFNSQRYQMAGLIRHQDYSAVVMGTSLVANYRASWFTEGLGEETDHRVRHRPPAGLPHPSGAGQGLFLPGPQYPQTA